jgi:predicted DNA-binding transcriptional regulator YafY
MNVKRITRLLKLLEILQSGSGQNADGLAEACDVSRRTVFRDIDALQAAGVPIAFDEQHDRYSIPGAYFLRPVNFTAAEALSLVALANEMGRSDRLPFYEPAHAAALKLEGSLPAALRDELRIMTRSIRIQPSAVSPLETKRGIFQQLVDARATRRVVRIEYDSLTEWERIRTKLRPYHLLFYRHSWYVIGRSSLHSAVRTFILSRIATLEVLPKRFRVPRGFSIERHLGNAWGLIPGDGPDQRVVVRFKPLVAQNVGEVIWHPTQQLEFEEDGSLVYQACVSGIHEVAWWILGYGDQAEVLKPTELRRLVAERATNMAAMYNKKSSGNGAS